MTRRDTTFDIAKGIGILLVLTCHFFGWNHPWLNRTISSFHMPLFFIIAGYFSKSYVDRGTTISSIKKYFKRLYWPFILTQSMIVLWLIMMVFAKHNSWNPVITSALSIGWADVYGPSTPWGNLSIGVVWFLIALLVAKILLIPLSRTGIWAIPISLITAFCVLLLHSVFSYSIWCISLGLMALPFVTIGWWIKNHKLPWWAYGIAVLGWIAAITFSEMDMYNFTWKCYPLDVLGACGGTFCIYLLSKFISSKTKITSKVLSHLGIWSLAIMCVHCFEMAAHLNNHVLAVISAALPTWFKYAFRYLLTIGLAIAIVHTPRVKKLFV